MSIKNEFQTRRKQLMEKIGPDAVAIFFAAPPAYRNGDSEYAYRQNSDFYYFTGFCEPHAVLVLAPGSATPVVLFNQVQDLKSLIWTGPRVGQQGAIDHYGVDAAFSIEKIDEQLPALLANKKIIYFPWGDACIREQMSKWIKQALKNTRHMPWPDLIAAQKLTANLRLIKSPVEINLLQQSATIAALAHSHAMQTTAPGMREYQLAAEYVYQFTQQGARDIAYLPIVAGGENACILHYTANDNVLRDGDLVLVDAGCEYQYYCSDVSRTFPVNGRFNQEQRAIYDVVLNAYLAGLKQIKPGNNWPLVKQAVDDSLIQGLAALKIPGALTDYFMHSPGHWLGLDVHDVGPYKIEDKPITFEAGMVLTLEPGIYINEPEILDKKWWHIGIRIEDDILVTAQGHQVLSKDAPILPEDIEQLMR